MPYGIAARDYLARAKKRLDEGTQEALFYAALELRAGVEARLQEYLHPHDHIPANRRTEWRVGNLYRTAADAFEIGDQVGRLALIDPRTRKLLVTFYYTPVKQRLKSLAERFGDRLHALQKRREDSDSYWDMFRGELREAVALLEEAVSGTMLGPMLLETGTTEARLPMEILPDAHETLGVSPKDLIGADLIADVSYHATLEEAMKRQPRIHKRR